ncbi:MAG: ribosome recycling factor [bacterium]|nr:ribosome recycling factor [bacterium]
MRLAIYDEIEKKMTQRIEGLRREFNQVRTGRASAALLDGIKVDYYGTPTPINQMASISVPDPRTLVIQPWDITILNQIEKAILKSDLGIHPTNDGKVIRLTIPMLTEERRKQLAKNVRNIAEEAKVAIRNIRREANDKLKEMEKSKEITEDEYHAALKEVQKITDNYIEKIGESCLAKEKEIMEI